MAGEKTEKHLRGHLHPDRGISEITLNNIGPEDYGIYTCIARYTLGDRLVEDMKAVVLEYGELLLTVH